MSQMGQINKSGKNLWKHNILCENKHKSRVRSLKDEASNTSARTS